MKRDYSLQLQSAKIYIYLILTTGVMLLAFTTYGPEFPFNLSGWIVAFTVYNIFECYSKIRSMIEEYLDRAEHVTKHMNRL